MKITQVNLDFRSQVDENHRIKEGGECLLPSPALYAAVDKKFRRHGEWTALSSFLERGVYTTYSGKRVCLAYPETKVQIFGKYLRVQKTTPTQHGDDIVTTYYEVTPILAPDGRPAVFK